MTEADLAWLCECFERTMPGVTCVPPKPIMPSYRDKYGPPRIAVPHGFHVVSPVVGASVQYGGAASPDPISVPEPDTFTLLLVGIAMLVAVAVGGKGVR